MELLDASARLAALGHETRLAVFRLLVEAGPEGLSAGVIAQRLALPAATLSFHLAQLQRVALVTSRRESRHIYYAASFEVMDSLIVFLTANCCQGEPCLPRSRAGEAAARGGSRRRVARRAAA